ncbi:hypothetical protein, partial [Accumulibacter sp.]|uniref:hypothetical protein n=1 Tax=Accumulibacter sp. TaxID=2053492 RepID=UPI00258BAB33
SEKGLAKTILPMRRKKSRSRALSICDAAMTAPHEHVQEMQWLHTWNAYRQPESGVGCIVDQQVTDGTQTAR